MYEKVSLEEVADSAIVLDGFNEAILGVVSSFEGPRIVYNTQKIIEILESQGMTTLEALEYWSYNILNSHMGNQNPVFLEVELSPSKSDLFDLRWSYWD